MKIHGIEFPNMVAELLPVDALRYDETGGQKFYCRNCGWSVVYRSLGGSTMPAWDVWHQIETALAFHAEHCQEAKP